jgi:hypothetical protein
MASSLAVFKRPCSGEAARCGQLCCGWLRSGCSCLKHQVAPVRCNHKKQLIDRYQTVRSSIFQLPNCNPDIKTTSTKHVVPIPRTDRQPTNNRTTTHIITLRPKTRRNTTTQTHQPPPHSPRSPQSHPNPNPRRPQSATPLTRYANKTPLRPPARHDQPIHRLASFRRRDSGLSAEELQRCGQGAYHIVARVQRDQGHWARAHGLDC